MRSPKPSAPKRRRQKTPLPELPTVPDHLKIPGLYYPVPGMTPDRVFEELGRLRRAAEERIEALIAFLDATEDTDTDEAIDDRPCDGCDDAEPDNDGEPDADGEPSVGFDATPDALEEDTGDDEPTLGWTVDGQLGYVGMDGECEGRDHTIGASERRVRERRIESQLQGGSAS